jgi:anchored repeat ABC transporter substrate-binding protein
VTRLIPRLPLAAAVVLASLLLSGCASVAAPVQNDRLQVITTTGILADLARNVGGDRIDVTAMVPDGADPHSHEPTLRNVRDVVYADVAFTNYLLLEEQSIIKTLDANLRDGVPNISLAEAAVKYSAEIIPLVEDVSLDTVWLGLRVEGDGAELGATRTSDVLLSATDVEGPGELVAYLTESFGNPDFYFDSTNGFDADSGYRDDTVSVPPDAHTHLSWAFTEPGIYRLTLDARLKIDQESSSVAVGGTVVTFAVGVDPNSVPGTKGATVLDSGHADVTVNLDTGAFEVIADHSDEGEATQERTDPADTVIEVPNKALHQIPAGPQYRFLGSAGDQVYQLPQAVLGKHVHGEIDPHLWQNVRNAQAYVEIMRDQFIAVDPEGAADYTANATSYIAELAELDDYVATTVSQISASNRHLITTHDAFGYLGKAYGISISGFVTPNPAVEPSLGERKKLTETIQNLRVPAVFLEPNLAGRSSTLQEVAREQGVEVCTIYGDAFDRTVTTYIQMMRFNADSLKNCLTGKAPADD